MLSHCGLDIENLVKATRHWFLRVESKWCLDLNYSPPIYELSKLYGRMELPCIKWSHYPSHKEIIAVDLVKYFKGESHYAKF